LRAYLLMVAKIKQQGVVGALKQESSIAATIDRIE